MHEIYKIFVAFVAAFIIGCAGFGLSIMVLESFTHNRVCQGTLSGIVAGIAFSNAFGFRYRYRDM